MPWMKRICFAMTKAAAAQTASEVGRFRSCGPDLMGRMPFEVGVPSMNQLRTALISTIGLTCLLCSLGALRPAVYQEIQ